MTESRIAPTPAYQLGHGGGGAASTAIFYRTASGHWHPLPAWASAFIALGEWVAYDARRGRVAAIVVAPTRAYGATLAATAVAALRQPLRFTDPEPGPDALAAYFDAIASLAPGSTVSLHDGRRRAVCEFSHVAEREGERYLAVRQRPGRRDEVLLLIPEDRAHWLEPAGIALSTLLVGQLNVLQEEVTSGEVATGDGRPLQQILKARRFANRRDTDIRSDVISSAADLPAELRDARPAVVVFDGASSFRRSKEAWTRSSWIVVLDRSSRDLAGAVELVNQEYAFRRGDDDPLAEFEPPPGIELLGFWLK